MTTREIEESEGPPAIDKKAFAELFFHRQTNERKIWTGMAEIVRRAAASVDITRLQFDDIDEMRGAAIIHCMEVARRPVPADPSKQKGGYYDPQRRTAYDYFYSVAKTFMKHSAGQRRDRTMGENDEKISFDDARWIEPNDAAVQARRSNPQNWVSFRLPDPRSRFLVEKYLKTRIRLAREACPSNEGKSWAEGQKRSKGERAVTVAMIEAFKQTMRALLDE